jgi:hypothetical protein
MQASIAPARALDAVEIRNGTTAGSIANRREPYSAGLPVKDTGFISGDVEFDIFLIDFLVAVHAVLLRVIPHRVIPPIKQRVLLGVVHRVAVIAAGIFLTRRPVM